MTWRGAAVAESHMDEAVYRAGWAGYLIRRLVGVDNLRAVLM